MEIELEEPKIKELEKIIFNPIVRIDTQQETKIMRIEIDDELTRIDFVYYPPSYYENGGWVQIDRNSFIRPVGTKHTLPLVKAVGIPYAQQKHYFKSYKEILYYTLYFPALPNDVKEIDIIEREVSFGEYFNFYGVSMNKIRTSAIKILN